MANAKSTRVYAPGRRCAHLLPFDRSPNTTDSATCGADPWPAFWRGTGDQNEHDTAAGLPLCGNCDRIVNGRPATAPFVLLTTGSRHLPVDKIPLVAPPLVCFEEDGEEIHPHPECPIRT